VKVKYSFVLDTGLAGNPQTPLLLKDYHLLLENEWNALFTKNEVLSLYFLYLNGDQLFL